MLVNSSINGYHNGELGDEIILNRPLNQLLANDVSIDSRLVTTEGNINTLQENVANLQVAISEPILQWF